MFKEVNRVYGNASDISEFPLGDMFGNTQFAGFKTKQRFTGKS